MSDLPNADPWALEAARLPLAFAQVREDPRLDVRLARHLPPDAEVVMIASGGETLVELARLLLRRIHAVDVNPAQLALARVKCYLADAGSPSEAAALLGHAPLERLVRRESVSGILDRMGLSPEVFGEADFWAETGLDHAGRYERCFAELRRAMPVWRDRFPVEALDEALVKVMSLTNLVALFGEGATQNPRQPFHAHFAERTRVALQRSDAGRNPFLRQMYNGCFAPGPAYDWLESAAPLNAEILWHQGAMDAVLEGLPARSVDLVHLSNILDWLNPEEARRTLDAVSRVLKPGGQVLIRQLNSTVAPMELAPDISWNETLGREMESVDRSFFYPDLLTGSRR
jgi:S-adenosylmethionine-diacylglycerol 3-amino-3-carboxypropyl transferase